MNKDFIIEQINLLVESHKLWNEMAEHIFALGGELWESKYAKAYTYHEKTVYDLIVMHRGHASCNEAEYDNFQDFIHDLAYNQIIDIFDKDMNVILRISSVEDFYNYMMHSS